MRPVSHGSSFGDRERLLSLCVSDGGSAEAVQHLGVVLHGGQAQGVRAGLGSENGA